MFFEDYVVGATREYGSVTLDEAEIIAFAKRYDNQAIHADPQKAAAGPFRGLIASGWQTCAVMMSMIVNAYLSDESSIVSPGVDELRWLLPVRPGDTLRVRATVLEATASASKPDRGLVRTHLEVLNQSDEVVMSLKPMNLVRRRPA